jgi:hypothetical protein
LRKGEAPSQRSFGHSSASLQTERLGTLIRRSCAASLMSNAKWRKLIRILLDIPSIDRYFVKLVRGPTEYLGKGRLDGWPPYAYADTSFGPLQLSEIEWIEFPGVITRSMSPSPRRMGAIQDLDALQQALASAGQFPVVTTDRGLRIFGHVRNPGFR